MYKELRVYISAAPEMDPECEVVGQLLASITRTNRATVLRTPRPHEASANPDVEALAQSDFYLILLGSDLMAPMGVEWQVARRSGRRTLGFRNAERPPSPAMTDFIRHSEFDWQTYRTPGEFQRRVEQALLQGMLDATPGLGLDLQDVEEISARLKALEEPAKEGGARPEERRGAGSGGIILPRP